MTTSYYASVLGIEFASLEVVSFSITSPLDGKAVALGESVTFEIDSDADLSSINWTLDLDGYLGI